MNQDVQSLPYPQSAASQSQASPSAAKAGSANNQSGIKDFILAYLGLTKPTIVLMVVVTTLGGLALAADDFLPLGLVLTTLVGTWLSASSASVFNHILDQEIDRTMARTRTRPIPRGQVTRNGAAIFGTLLGIASWAVLYWGTTPLAAWIGLAGNIFYVVIYTWYLKPRTSQNIVIGGAAGSVGPLIGWAAVQGELALAPWLLFLLIFLWTPPHFWALALKYRDDYAKAGVPMLPVTHGDSVTRNQILIYTLTILPIFPVLYWIGATSIWAMALCLLFSLIFTGMAFDLWRSRSNARCMPLFHYSCLYILIVFLLISFDKLLLA